MRWTLPKTAVVLALLTLLPSSGWAGDDADKAPAGDSKPVSFYRQVRPILQRHCSGCHFAAKKGGKLMLTSFADFRKGGENGATFTAGISPAEVHASGATATRLT